MNELARRMASVSVQKASFRTTRRVLPQFTAIVGGGDRNELPFSRLRQDMGPNFGTFHASTQRMLFSTQAATISTGRAASSSTTASIVTDETSGQQYGVLLDTRKLPQLKPGIVQKRLANCKTYIGRETGIRQSPWKLNRICQLAAGLTLEEALTQLKFCDLKNSELVAKVLKRTSNLADIRHGIQMSQLEVAECFTNKSMMLKRVKPMGRGRSGVLHHKFSNIRVVLREIDFPLRIYQQKSLNQKKKWLRHQQRAEQDARAAKAKRDEMDRLEKQQAEQLQERKAAAKK